MSITLFKNDLSKDTGKFLIWSSDKSLRCWYAHVFNGTTTPRVYFTIHWLGFVAAGSFRQWAARKGK